MPEAACNPSNSNRKVSLKSQSKCVQIDHLHLGNSPTREDHANSVNLLGDNLTRIVVQVLKVGDFSGVRIEVYNSETVSVDTSLCTEVCVLHGLWNKNEAFHRHVNIVCGGHGHGAVAETSPTLQPRKRLVETQGVFMTPEPRRDATIRRQLLEGVEQARVARRPLTVRASRANRRIGRKQLMVR